MIYPKVERAVSEAFDYKSKPNKGRELLLAQGYCDVVAERDIAMSALRMLVGGKDWTFNVVCEAKDEDQLHSLVSMTDSLWDSARLAIQFVDTGK